MLEKDFDLANYAFELPRERIAQFPPAQRGDSRLLAVSRSNADFGQDAAFRDLPRLLPENALLVANNSAVIPARLSGQRQSGGRAEFLLLTPLPLLDRKDGLCRAEGLLRPAGRIRLGEEIRFGRISAKILEKGEFGACVAELSWSGEFEQALAESGTIPLPPYIRREACDLDASRYQTVYASEAGSVAAPTAGLHFTPEIRAELAARNTGWAEISLHVGYGTFSPVRAQDIREHRMHPEYISIGEETACAIRIAQENARPIIAVGTTAMRALEGVAAHFGEIRPFRGMLNPFIYPGFKFQVANGLITNFHLPESTLLMLVAAFMGRERTLAWYKHAIRQGYRFFSYGDAMLIAP